MVQRSYGAYVKKPPKPSQSRVSPIHEGHPDSATKRFYDSLSLSEQERYDERVGIMQYDGLLSYKEADYKAFIEILKLRRAKYNMV